MKQLAVGILAHVDAGKTTLSEAMLFEAGQLKTLGRVDHKNAFLDTDALEQQRGITIFAKQAVLPLQQASIALLDTPGHADFSAEAERTLQVLDYAVLVISGTDGVQGHTETLWNLLHRYAVPTFLFVNKMDMAGTDKTALLAQLNSRLAEGCMDFETQTDAFFEEAALHSETAMNQYLETGRLSTETLQTLIKQRKIFPCFFGSALKLQGVDALLEGLQTYTKTPFYPEQFGAKVFKTSRDANGTRLTHMKITGGILKVKDLLQGGAQNAQWQQKADAIRIYSGEKFKAVQQAPAGTICAVTGLSHTAPGDALGIEGASLSPLLHPVLTYQLLLPEGEDIPTALAKLRQLQEEDPQMGVVWNEALGEIHLHVMGAVQLEVLAHQMQQRFGLAVRFGAGSIVYQETIKNKVEGVGHFEPLRHYAEVHLVLEPAKEGTGVQFATKCSEDVLGKNWQQLVLTHLAEKPHLGVLTGAPITDVKITLTTGRAHPKHTEGGDFRQATYRAVRQGLMQAESVLLEPWYSFRLELPAENLGRAMADVQRMSGEFALPEQAGEIAVLQGSAPVATLQGYAAQVAAYTHGQGRLQCTPAAYKPCHNAEQVIQEAFYQPEHDLENTADSVFCTHGAGFVVPWDEVPQYMHLESTLKPKQPDPLPQTPSNPPKQRATAGSLEEDKQLKAIFEKTYGKKPEHDWRPTPTVQTPPAEYLWEDMPEYLLVDGYNIIFDWPALKKVAAENLDAARQMLMDILANYQGFKKCGLILVFDAYKVAGSKESIERYNGIYVVYTKEAETADSYIEKTTYKLAKQQKVRVATSDGAEQLIVLGHGALRMSASMLWQEVQLVKGQIDEIVEQNNARYRSRPMEAALEQAKRKQKQQE